MDVLFALIFFISIGFVIYYSVKRYQSKTKEPDTYNRVKNRVWYAALVALFAIGAGAGVIGFFSIIVLMSLGTIIYYIIKMIQTRKKDPVTYNKIKHRIWYAVLVFIISYIIVIVLPQPSSTTANHTDIAKVDSNKEKQEQEKKKQADESSKKESESTAKEESESTKIESESIAKEESENTKMESESIAKESSESVKEESESNKREESIQKVNDEKAKVESTKQASNAAAKAQSKKASNQQKQTATTQRSTTNSNAGQVTTGGATIIGNTRSKIYHVPGQAGYHMSSSNAITFQSEQEAQAAGYRKSLR